jgi:hypothetical protein
MLFVHEEIFAKMKQKHPSIIIKKSRYTPPMTIKRKTRFFTPARERENETGTSVIHPEFHADTHSGQLNIQVAEDTRDSNNGNIVTTNKALAITILPDLSAGVIEDSLTGTTTTTHDTSDTTNSTNGASRVRVTLLVRRSLSSGSSGTGVNGSTGTGGSRDSNLGREERTTRATDPGMLGVGAVHQTILKEEGGTVGNQGITLHLSDTDTTTLGTTLHGLTGESVNGTGGTHLELVVHHVTQTLVVHQTHVDISGELAACDSTVQRLIAVVIVACLAELLAEVVGCGVFFGELEGC